MVVGWVHVVVLLLRLRLCDGHRRPATDVHPLLVRQPTTGAVVVTEKHDVVVVRNEISGRILLLIGLVLVAVVTHPVVDGLRRRKLVAISGQ